MKNMLIAALVLTAGSASAQVLAVDQLKAFAPRVAESVAPATPASKPVKQPEIHINISGSEAAETYARFTGMEPKKLVGQWICVAMVRGHVAHSTPKVGPVITIYELPDVLNPSENVVVWRFGDGLTAYPLKLNAAENHTSLSGGGNYNCRANETATAILCKVLDPEVHPSASNTEYSLFLRARPNETR